jgi:hypothetical protein
MRQGLLARLADSHELGHGSWVNQLARPARQMRMTAGRGVALRSSGVRCRATGRAASEGRGTRGQLRAGNARPMRPPKTVTTTIITITAIRMRPFPALDAFAMRSF